MRRIRPTGSFISRPRAIPISQSCSRGWPVRLKNRRMSDVFFDLAAGDHLFGKNLVEDMIEGDFGVWPFFSSQCAVAFITPSGSTSRGQA